MGHTEKERTGRFQQLNSLQHAGVKDKTFHSRSSLRYILHIILVFIIFEDKYIFTLQRRNVFALERSANGMYMQNPR